MAARIILEFTDLGSDDKFEVDVDQKNGCVFIHNPDINYPPICISISKEDWKEIVSFVKNQHGD